MEEKIIKCKDCGISFPLSVKRQEWYLAKGWTPYTLLGYVLNAGEKTKLIVDNSSFDDMDMQITGYTEYGIGVTKSFKYSAWSCSLQIVGKSGNREGFGSNLEIKYRF